MTVDKAALRRRLGQAVRALTPEDRAVADAAIQRHLAPRVGEGLVLAYVALADEVDLGPLLTGWASEGRLVLPRVDGHHLTLHRVADLADLAVGAFGIREPVGPEDVGVADLTTVVVPGRGFDTDGQRLGRGRGYYDRLLAEGTARRFGVAYAVQRVERLPHEAHDVPMHAVVTDDGLHWASDAG